MNMEYSKNISSRSMNNKDQMLKSVKQRYNIVGNCDALNRAIDLALKVARVDLSVLVLGENGSGKEIMPRIIHDASPRKGKKYLALNCGAIPEGTIDSELFGHVEGAFTGSVGKREGYFAAADGGTLFLDEVGELPLQTQVRLLRVLETGEYIPVGANEPRKTNVRIVAATNVDMHRAIREGRFREDLFYRLSAVTISIPPLRERGTDIDMLFRMFALENQNKYQTPPIRLNEQARQLLTTYPWPGNVRQLKNVVDSMSILCEEREITPDTLALFIPIDQAHTQITPLATANYPTADGSAIGGHDLDIIMHMIKSLAQEVSILREEVDALKKNHSMGGSAQLVIQPKDNHTDAIPDDNFDDFLAADIIEEVLGSEIGGTVGTATEERRPKTLQEIQEEQIRESLKRNGGNRRKTAQELNLSERTLYRKLNEMGLNRKGKNDS